jgi:hypothetical protein
MTADKIYQEILKRAPALGGKLNELSIDQVWQSPKTYREHPLIPMFRSLIQDGIDISTLHVTNEAIRQFDLRPEHGEWLRSRLASCLQIDDFSSSASALGEVRAGGALLQGGFRVHPIAESRTPTCDFQITYNGLEAYVEVATKQMSGTTVDYLNSSRDSREKSICPGGVPDPDKDGETIGENVGHKFASIKPKAKQVPTGSVALLWVDVQDEDWWPADITHTKPVVSSNGEFYSGGIWHGFYGSKGTPLFERQSTEERIKAEQYTQSYPGLFSQHDRWSAAVLSFRNGAVVFEHPSPAIPMPESLARQLLTLPNADYSEWWVKWPLEQQDALSERINRTISELESLAKVASYLW